MMKNTLLFLALAAFIFVPSISAAEEELPPMPNTPLEISTESNLSSGEPIEIDQEADIMAEIDVPSGVPIEIDPNLDILKTNIEGKLLTEEEVEMRSPEPERVASPQKPMPYIDEDIDASVDMDVAVETPVKKPNIFVRIWNFIKGLFGFGK